MAFLTPLFLVGLGALAIPVLIHLIQRERKRVVEFPSLMFVRRIPYQSVRRRRIRHWGLLLLRAAAMALIVMAFARPFFRRDAAVIAATGGERPEPRRQGHARALLAQRRGEHARNVRPFAPRRSDQCGQSWIGRDAIR